MQTGLVERSSGLFVPSALSDAPETPVSATLDADGRRRVVLTKEERKKLLAAVRLLEDHGFGLVIRCQDQALRVRREGGLARILKPAAAACGQLLAVEGGADPGSGCRCARIHLRID